MEYVLRSDCLDLTGGVPEKIRDIFSRFDRVCFAGHTHDPGIITEDSQFIHPKECNHEFVFQPGKKYFVNLGSVGQPRDGDTRACYVLFDGKAVTFRRVGYNYRKTARKIKRIKRLPNALGARLSLGL
jgi:diadenosine tetraphosphatase ApaH/serine/threonine PP2A family protein phosphatase